MDIHILQEKSKSLAIRINRLSEVLYEQHEFTIPRQLEVCIDNIESNIAELKFVDNEDVLKQKLKRAIKKTDEIDYWMKNLQNCHINNEYGSISVDCRELINLLTAIVNTLNK